MTEESKTLTEVASTYNQVSTDYDQELAGDGASKGRQLFFDLYDRLTWRSIERYLPEDRSLPVLDAGGGTGKWSIRIAEQGYTDIRMLDLSAGMLEQASKRLTEAGFRDVVSLHEGDIRHLPWPDETFAFVLCEADAVGYCRFDAEKAVAELVRVCRAGDPLLISVDDLLGCYLLTLLPDGVEAATEVATTRSTVDPYDIPIRCFSPKEMTRILNDAGAEVVEVLTKPAVLHFLVGHGQRLVQEGFLDELYVGDAWACEQGYLTGGSHLQVVACRCHDR